MANLGGTEIISRMYDIYQKIRQEFLVIVSIHSTENNETDSDKLVKMGNILTFYATSSV